MKSGNYGTVGKWLDCDQGEIEKDAEGITDGGCMEESCHRCIQSPPPSRVATPIEIDSCRTDEQHHASYYKSGQVRR